MTIHYRCSSVARSANWEERREAIRRMVDADMTDGQIGAEFGVTGVTICRVRKDLGIDRPLRKMTAEQARANFLGTAPEPLVGTTYVDENGLTVTRYPARFAGDLPPRVTARPKR